MKHLPEFVQNRDGVLVRKGMTYNLALSEKDLNEFLVSQNPLFQDFRFAFKDNSISATGKSGGLIAFANRPLCHTAGAGQRLDVPC
ncbi:hypothetical protein ACFTAO_35010 [Paenibacillus rhizoplanae]